MINPTADWMHAHGLYSFGVEILKEYYRYEVSGDGGTWYALVTKTGLRSLKTDRAKREIVYAALEKAMEDNRG